MLKSPIEASEGTLIANPLIQLEQAIPVVSIIIPTGNEGVQLLTNITDFLKQYYGYPLAMSTEIILATDIYNPLTHKSMSKLCETLQCRSYFLSERIGKGGTVKNLAQLARGSIVVIMDADVPTPLANVHQAIRLVSENNADLVIAERMTRSDGSLRLFLSIGYNLLVRIVFRTKQYDHQAGFKVLKANLLHKVLGLARTDGLGFDTELIVWARKSGARITTLPVEWDEKRQTNSSNVIPVRALLTMLADLLFLRTITIGNDKKLLIRRIIGNIVDSNGKVVSAEYMTTLSSKRPYLLNLLRRLYLAVAFRK